MILADTSVWIEFLRKNNPVLPLMREKLEKCEILTVEWIFGELLQGAKNERETKIITAYWNHLPRVEETGIWIEAGMLSYENRLPNRGIGLIDSAILVAAKRSGAPIWTLDKKLMRIIPPEQKYMPYL